MQNHRKLWWFYKLIPVKLPHEKWKLNKENLSSKNIELTLRRKQENPLSIKDLIEGVAEPELSALLFGLEPKSNFFSQLRLLLFPLKNRRYYTGQFKKNYFHILNVDEWEFKKMRSKKKKRGKK